MDEKDALRDGGEAAFGLKFRGAFGRTELATGRVAVRARNMGVVYIVLQVEWLLWTVARIEGVLCKHGYYDVQGQDQACPFLAGGRNATLSPPRALRTSVQSMNCINLRRSPQQYILLPR